MPLETITTMYTAENIHIAVWLLVNLANSMRRTGNFCCTTAYGSCGCVDERDD